MVSDSPYTFSRLREASKELRRLSSSQREHALLRFADALEAGSTRLLEACNLDIAAHREHLSNSEYARLELTREKIDQIADGARALAALPDPVGRRLSATLLDDGLVLEKQAVPLGVFGVIFESRSDVLPQILALALKSANGVVLKGGSETRYVSKVYVDLVASIAGLPLGWFQVYNERAVVDDMLSANGEIDLIIPRGSNKLVQSIMGRTKIPVLGHADGVCHIYVDKSADIAISVRIVIDSKAQYPAACNAVETVLIHRERVEQFLPKLVEAATIEGIELRGEDELRKFLPTAAKITFDGWHCEYGALILAIKVVDSLDEAVAHIARWGSGHTDCILTEDNAAAELFLAEVDSANVYHNCSTRFADGYRYGLGAEVGISTGRIHARGPVGIEGLMTYRYVLRGKGQLVETYVKPSDGSQARRFLHQAVSE